MKEAFREELGLSKKNKEQLEVINRIIEEYQAQGYTLTLRQLYYQLVSRDIIPNRVQEYAKLSTLLVKGRMAGFVDWDAIEDRVRVPFLPYWCIDPKDGINDLLKSYRVDRMKEQDVYVELWVEKDALSGVLRRVTSKYHVNLMVNRGYSSCSAMHDAFKRIKTQEDNGKQCYILYLGDHDASGLDMIRDIRERLEEFGVSPEIKPIALTMNQIKQYDPPPNPAKITDPRAKWYIEEYGNQSWEVDALKPEILHTLVGMHIERLIDMDIFNKQLEIEEIDKEKLSKVAEDFENETDEM